MRAATWQEVIGNTSLLSKEAPQGRRAVYICVAASFRGRGSHRRRRRNGRPPGHSDEGEDAAFSSPFQGREDLMNTSRGISLEARLTAVLFALMSAFRSAISAPNIRSAKWCSSARPSPSCRSWIVYAWRGELAAGRTHRESVRPGQPQRIQHCSACPAISAALRGNCARSRPTPSSFTSPLIGVEKRSPHWCSKSGCASIAGRRSPSGFWACWWCWRRVFPETNW